MTRELIFRLVPFDLVHAYMRAGWIIDGELHAPHCYYSLGMRWLCLCPLPEITA